MLNTILRITLLTFCFNMLVCSNPTLVRRGSGEGTYYDATGAIGACGIDERVNVVAINAAEYGSGDYCGKCVKITGALGSAVAKIVDKCPGCSAGSLDLSEDLFPKVDDKDKGRVPIQWEIVDC